MKNEYINVMKIAYILNCLIFLFCFISFMVMFTSYKFTFIEEPMLETTKIGAFRFFTVDSNLLMGIMAFLLAYKERQMLLGKIKEIPSKYYILKFIATVGVSLTMIVVFAYLGGIAKGGLISLLQNSNLFFHFIIPVLSIITFLCFERTNKISGKYVIYGLIPVFLYGIFYVINIILHLENGKVPLEYDWYAFAQGSIKEIVITIIIMFVLTFVISIILWVINRKKDNNY